MKEKHKVYMFDRKHLVTKMVNETVKWAAIGLLTSASLGVIMGFLLSLYFR